MTDRTISLDQYRHRLDDAVHDGEADRLRDAIVTAVANYCNYFEGRGRPIPTDNFEIPKT